MFHVLTGVCSQLCYAGPACETIKHYFAFPAGIMQFLVDVLTTEGLHVSSREDVALVTQSLGVKDEHWSCSSVREMADSLHMYASHLDSVGAGIGRPASDLFERFETLLRASLVALCCMHGLPVTQSHALMKQDVMKHIVDGACVMHWPQQGIGCDNVCLQHV